MTIAAGFICTDGLVVCADTEHASANTNSKTHKSKVFQAANQKLIVTGANTADYIKVGYDKLCERLNSGFDPVDRLAARAIVEEVMSKLYEQHIIPFQVGDPDLGVDLIVAMRCADGRPTLMRTVNSTAMLVDEPYTAMGSGFEFFNYWATYFMYKMKLNMELASHVAAFMFREIKAAGLNCSGPLFPRCPQTLKARTHEDTFSEKAVYWRSFRKVQLMCYSQP
jgi:20S proteasome alpha/beta subunit